MALTPATLIAAVKTQIETVAGIGVVYDFRREVRDESTARAVWYHAGQTRIHAWSVTLAEPPARTIRHPGFGAIGSGQSGTILTDFGIAIEAVFGIDDAAESEKTFRTLCWDVVLNFNKVGLVSADVTHQEPLQWERFGYLRLANMFLVHYASMTGRFTGQVAP